MVGFQEGRQVRSLEGNGASRQMDMKGGQKLTGRWREGKHTESEKKAGMKAHKQ
jgi:hypothetical protein